MKASVFTSALLLGAASAFPSSLSNNPEISDETLLLMQRGLESVDERQQDPLKISKARTNCGPTPCLVFNEADQKVSVSGPHRYASPGAADIRGPCPGLNAAANHGYLPRSGIATIEETVAGLSAAYNLGRAVTAFLAAYAVTVDGNVAEGVWSIGGPLPPDLLGAGVLGNGQGLSYSHNNYEGDASIGRGDAYTHKGDAHSLQVSKFEQVYKTGGNDQSLNGRKQRFTLDKFVAKFEREQDHSIATNPYYFTGLFSTVVVVPAAYNFVINLMSNHSAAEPSGYLDGYNFKSFFGIVGKPGSFVWKRGQERIPDDWYRRTSTNPYEGNQVGQDVAIGYAAYPRTLKIGGNTGKVNSFTGINVAKFTGGVFNAQTLLSGNNFTCFAFQLAQNGLPDFLQGGLAQANAFLSPFTSAVTAGLNCPALGKYDQSLFNKYPGRKYNPKGPATNYKE